MPNPSSGESLDDFMSRCIPIVMRDGTAGDNKQAAAICGSMYRDAKKHELEDIDAAIKVLTAATYTERVPGVEIFRAGKWNGDAYSEADLDEMVANFGKVGFDVPVKLGHAKDDGEPAYGWVERLSRIGDRLIANLRDVPKQIYEAIKDRRFDAVSAEIFWNLERNGEKFRRVLKAVSLLGAETPAVAGLKPLRDSMRGFADWNAAPAHTYTITKETNEMDTKALAMSLGLAEDAKPEAIEAKINELKGLTGKVTALTQELETAKQKPDNGVEVKNLTDQVTALSARLKESEDQSRKVTIDRKIDDLKVPALKDHFRALYAMAMSEAAPKTVAFTFKKDGKDETRQDKPEAIVDDLLVKINNHVAKLFGEVGGHGHEPRANDVPDKNPGAEVDRLVKEHRTKNPALTYKQAQDAILGDPNNAELKRAFARHA